MQSALALAVLLLGASLLQWILRAVLGRWLVRWGRKAEGPLAVILHHDVLRYASYVVLPLVTHLGVRAVPHLPDALRSVIDNVALAVTVLVVARTLLRMLDVMLTTSARHAAEHGLVRSRSVKMYVQVGQLLVGVSALVIVIAALSDKSPLIVLSSLGAMSAVVLLIFQDTIRSFVSGMQIENNDMLRVGDWIEMPQADADGFVIDVALHTVKVQNWDKTIVAIPTWRLMSESFKNWRGMSESGGRRIKRALHLDQASVRFLDPAERDALRRFTLLRDYLDTKERELADWNAGLGADGELPVNARRITNLGTFSAYVERYLRHHPQVHRDLTLLVRQLQPGPTGLPLEIYCFTSDTRWAVYEGIQSDIFDHLLAILPEFGLRVFQASSDAPLQVALTDARTPPRAEVVAGAGA